MAVVIPAPQSGPHDFGGCSVLVVDPVLGMRRMLRDTLKNLGCASVEDTGKTREAWDALRLGGIHALFLDWSEEIDAPAFLHSLRAEDGDLRFLPVVIMTAYCRSENVEVARDAGANEFMLRPFSPDVVASRLSAIVHHTRLFIANGAFFGPDRRRRHVEWRLPERRTHQNWQGQERRNSGVNSWYSPERRHGHPGFEPLERRVAPRV